VFPGWSSLKSKVGRRLLLLFISCAVVPLIITLYLSFSHVTDQLYQQSEARLRHESKAVGMAVVRELLILPSELKRIAATPVDATGAQPQSMDSEFEKALRERFRALTLIDRTGVAWSLFGPLLAPASHGAEETKHLASGKSLLSIHEGGDRSARPVLETAVDGGDIVAVIAELNAEWLARSAQQALTIPTTAFCLLDSNEPVIACSSSDGTPPPRVLPPEVERTALGNFRSQDNGEEHLVSFRSIFLKPNFLEASWLVVLGEPSRLVLAPLDEFRLIFPSVILITILVVAMLSFGQIRRLLCPLEALILGTQRISNREFGIKVNVESGDEFEELAASLNSMSGWLRKQFSTLDQMIEIDRSILSAMDVDAIAAPILERIGDLYASDCVALLLMETATAETMTSFLSDSGRGDLIRREAKPLSADDSKWLRDRDENTPVVIDSDVPHYLESLTEIGMVQAIVLPLWIDRELAGLLLLGHRVADADEPEKLIYARQLADQAAVALSNVRRVEENRILAYYDSLTGLPNRLLFMEHLRQSLRRAHRDGHRVAICLMDLDEFKQINDTLGHNAGDQLLKTVAQRLRGRLRSGTVARIGGDEFAFCLTNFSGVDSPARVAQGLLSEITRPYTLRNQEVFITASVGIAIYPADGNVLETVVKNADAAMFHAKREGRNNYQFYTPSMNAMAIQRLAMENALRKSIELDQLRVFYQPVVDIQTREVMGAEALLRWIHPEFGVVSPTEFIPLAEESGLIIEIGEWVLREACKQARAWHDAGHRLFSISVNVSSRQFKDGAFFSTVQRALSDTGLSPHNLTLELTESLLLDVEAVTITLGRLRGLGVKIAIDDFGTGFSSLGYLKHFPLDALKIDQVFIRNLETNTDDSAITDAIITLGHSLKLQVVAEGVETEEQLARLRQANCDTAQGFLFSEPVPADGFEKLLLEGDNDA
jgi:diguanylate cyclase (GGDEF)-like protein